MKITVFFHSYFKELTGCTRTDLELPTGTTIAQLREQLHEQFPKLRQMAKSTLVAVGVEYQPAEYVLHDGDEVSLFPPVQGG